MKISLRAARINVNMTIKQVADKIGVTDEKLRNFERGRTVVSEEKLEGLLNLYGITKENLKEEKRLSGKTPKQFSRVVIVDNETAEKTSGTILKYTPEEIVIVRRYKFEKGSKLREERTITFDATKVHFE